MHAYNVCVCSRCAYTYKLVWLSEYMYRNVSVCEHVCVDLTRSPALLVTLSSLFTCEHRNFKRRKQYKMIGTEEEKNAVSQFDQFFC